MAHVLLFSLTFSLLVTVLVAWLFGGKDRRLSERPFSLPEVNLAFISSMYERSKRKCLTKAVMVQWPTLLESMAVATAAGLNVMQAFEVCANRLSGPLKQSAEKVVLRLRSGISLPAALGIMEKDGVDVAKGLKTTLAQAEALGTPVSDVLETLSKEYYVFEKQSFESQLNSLPVKLSVITVVFLLPPVLIVSVMPHVLSFVRASW